MLFPSARAKGRHTLSRAGQAGLWKSSADRRPAQEVSPAGSVGAERCPPGTSAPRRGFPAKSLPQEAFSTLLRLPKATKAVELCSTPRKPFEKGLSENFTCLHPTQARAFQLAAPRKPHRPKAACATCPVRPRTAKCPAGPRAHRIVGGAYYGKENPIRRRYYGRKRMRP